MTNTIRLEEVEAELTALNKKIAKLRAQLEPLEERRETVKTVRDFMSGRSATLNADIEHTRDNSRTKMTIAEYALRALREKENGWLDTRSLIAVMEKIGFQSNARNLYTNIFGTLNREAQRPNTEFAKKDGKWGLQEWLNQEESEEMS
jgi:hypothetical protein